jgi:hypothetical protein
VPNEYRRRSQNRNPILAASRQVRCEQTEADNGQRAEDKDEYLINEPSRSIGFNDAEPLLNVVRRI